MQQQKIRSSETAAYYKPSIQPVYIEPLQNFEEVLLPPMEGPVEQQKVEVDLTNIRYPSLHSERKLIDDQVVYPSLPSMSKYLPPQPDQKLDQTSSQLLDEQFNYSLFDHEDEKQQLLPQNNINRTEVVLQQAQEIPPTVCIDQVTKIIEDYFKAPVVLSNEERSEIIRAKLEENKHKFEQIRNEKKYQNLTQNLITQDLPKVKESEQGVQEPVGEVQMTWINGKQFLIHNTKPNDTLQRLSLIYNVSQQLIKLNNDLLTDNLYSKPKIMIPVIDGMNVPSYEPETEAQKLKREKDRRQNQLRMMKEYIRRKLEHNGDFTAEALFYLAENQFEFLKAKEAYDIDFNLS